LLITRPLRQTYNFGFIAGGMALFATSANPGTQFITGESRSMKEDNNGALEQVQKAIEKYQN